MKFLHVSDLHFGKSIHGVNLYEDQRYWIDRFVELADELKPDIILVAGDIYDKSVPSSDATELLDYFFTKLSGLNIPACIIAGNHDSGRKLQFASSFMEKDNIYIAGTLQRELKVVTLEDENGKVNFWLMPYVYPALVSNLLDNNVEGDTKEYDSAQGCEAVEEYDNLEECDDVELTVYETGKGDISSYETAVKKILSVQNVNKEERNVIVAHQNVVAAGQAQLKGGSETTVGGSGQVSYEVFEDFEYAALGHIHAAYHVGRESVRYAGSPMCYHFDETRQEKKGPLLVTLGKKGEEVKIERYFIEALHKLREIKGTYNEICEQLNENKWENEFVKIVITDRRVDANINNYLKKILSDRQSLLLEIKSEYNEFGSIVNLSGVSETEKSIDELFEDLYKIRKSSEGLCPQDADMIGYLSQLTLQHMEKGERGEVPEEDVDNLLRYIIGQGE